MFKKLIIGFLLATGIASAALVETDRALVDQVKNILDNPGFENGKARWTASGGTFTVSSTGKAFGAAGALFDSSSASQTLTSTAVTIPEGLKGRNAVVSCAIKTVSGTATHKLQAYDGTNVVAEAVITSNTAGFARTSVNFIAPSSGSLSARVIAVAADEPQIYVDDCVVGLAEGFNLSQVSQASFVGRLTYAATASCEWSHATAAAYTSFAADTDCPSPSVVGSASAPGTKIPAVTFSNLAPGRYQVFVTGQFTNDTNGVATSYRLTDGTTAFGESVYTQSTSFMPQTLVGDIEYTSAQSSVTFQLQARIASGTARIINSGATSGLSLTFTVYRFPSTSELAVSPTQQNYDWTAYTPTFTGFGTVSSSTCFHKREGSDQLIQCTFTPGTTTATEARVSLGGGFTSRSSIPTVQAVGNWFIASNGASTDAVLIEPSVGYVTFGHGYTSGSPLTKATGSGITASGVVTSFYARVPIQGWIQTNSAPLLVGSVTSNSSGSERIERIRFGGAVEGTNVCTSSPCTIYRQSGSWVTSVTRNSTGNYTLNIAAGIFSAPPSCTMTTGRVGSDAYFSEIATPTATAVTIASVSNGTLTATDGTFEVICMGPR